MSIQKLHDLSLYTHQKSAPFAHLFLLFKLKNHEFTLKISDKNNFLYIADQHTLNLIEALELSAHQNEHKTGFHIEHDTISEQKTLPPQHIDLGKEVRHIALLAVVALSINLFLLSLDSVRIIGNNKATIFLCFLSGLGGLWFAYRYMRKTNHQLGKLLAASILAIMLMLMMLPVGAYLPIIFGTTTQETFVIIEKTSRQLVWQSSSNPTLMLFIETSPTQQHHLPPIGTTKLIKIHHGFWDLYSISEADFQTLQQPY